jgi:predicted Fe-Mo cluster-binding NifX family protein
MEMMERVRVAVPSTANGGLQARCDPHFGRCRCFTVVEVAPGEQHKVLLVENLAHHDCQGPVDLLASHGVRALIVEGIGMRPLVGFIQAGIKVYRGDGGGTVRELVDAYVCGQLPPLDETGVCGGGRRRRE